VLEHLAILPLAMLIGIVLGSLGSGGAILSLPILVYVAGLPVKQAVAVAQLVVGVASLVGTLLQWRLGRVAWKEVLLFGLAGIPATRAGSWLADQVEPQGLMVGFAFVVIVAGGRMFWMAGEDESGTGSVIVSLLFGALIGLLTGFLGVGGGFLLVPALIAFGGLDVRRATATSLPVIAINSLSGALQQQAQWSAVMGLAVSFLGATLVGTFIGLKLGHSASEEKLKRALGIVLIGVGTAVGLVNLLRG
jgi:uncharacterized membrane protein YfcA